MSDVVQCTVFALVKGCQPVLKFQWFKKCFCKPLCLMTWYL